MTIAPRELFERRLERLRLSLAREELDGLIVTSLPNIAYLTGFFASAAALVVHAEGLCLIGDGRYADPLAERASSLAITAVLVEPGSSYDEAVVAALMPLAGLRIGVESAHLTLQRYRSFVGRLAAAREWSQGLVETSDLVEQLRLVKDPWELAQLREGASRLSEVAKCILPKVLAGRAEAEVAAEIDAALRRGGFERPAFDTIVAAGVNAARPHARATERRIAPGELVVVDLGGVLNGYCTDLTRTVAIPPVGRRERQLFERLAEAQAAAFAVLRPGLQPEAADAAARQHLAQYGLADAFPHSTGHGLGLEVHEGPRLTRARPDRAEPPLSAGMVVTLEPGLYFAGWGGARIEDDVVVTEAGAEWLTHVPKQPS